MLFQRSPLVVDPALAAVIGLREAIVVQQMHYWLQMSRRCRDRKRWVYNSYAEWRKQFPFLSESQIRSTFLCLERPFTPTDPEDPRPARGPVLLSRQDLNRIPSDRTKWYSLDYEELLRLNTFAEAICDDQDNAAPPDEEEDDPFFAAERLEAPVTSPVRKIQPQAETLHSAHRDPPPNPDSEELYRQVRKQHFTEFSSLLYPFLGGDLQGKPLDDWLSELLIHAQHGHPVTRAQVEQAVHEALHGHDRAKQDGLTYPRTITWVTNALKAIMQESLAPPPPPRPRKPNPDPQAVRATEARKRISPLDALKKQVSNPLHPMATRGT